MSTGHFVPVDLSVQERSWAHLIYYYKYSLSIPKIILRVQVEAWMNSRNPGLLQVLRNMGLLKSPKLWECAQGSQWETLRICRRKQYENILIV